jgi:hypothetical protein
VSRSRIVPSKPLCDPRKRNDRKSPRHHKRHQVRAASPSTLKRDGPPFWRHGPRLNHDDRLEISIVSNYVDIEHAEREESSDYSGANGLQKRSFPASNADHPERPGTLNSLRRRGRTRCG